MKNLILLLVFLLSTFITNAQVATTFFPGKDAFKSFPELKQSRSQVISTKRMLQVDTEKLLKDDQESERMDNPFRFGYVFDVNYTLNDGTWAEMDSMRIWSLKIASPGAYSLNFIFDELHLSPGTQLYIFNAEGSMVYGPVTETQNIEDGVFMTDLVAGSEVNIQLMEPSDNKEKSFLRISKVIHAYKNMFLSDTGVNLRASSASNCYIDAICYPDWLKEADGVALILFTLGKVGYAANGSILNNTAQDFKPYFLTAFHCIDIDPVDGVISSSEKAAIESSAFRFQYRYTTCGGSVLNTATTYTYNNAYLRASWKDTDFALLELKTAVNPNLVTFLGWDRGGSIPSKSTCINHQGVNGLPSPQQIAFDYDSPVSNTTTISFGNGVVIAPINSHWIIGIDDGNAGEGASGAPLFDANKRVIGQLHGGSGSCLSSLSVYFGKFNLSWTGGGSASTRLSDWLDPLGAGVMTTNSIRIPSIIGPDLIPCSGSVFYSIPAGSTNITWSVPSNLQIVSGQGTNIITVSKSSSGTSQSATIMATGLYYGTSFNLSNTVSVGARYITSLSASATNVGVGASVNFVASPNFPAPEGDYEWMVSPTTGVSQSAYRNTNSITFKTAGSYTIGVRSTSSCITPGTYTMKQVYVGSSSATTAASSSTSIVVDNSRHAKVSFDPNISSEKHSFSWRLSNLTTGVLATSGHISSKGGTLNFSKLSTGIYLLQIDTGSGISETHKIVLK